MSRSDFGNFCSLHAMFMGVVLALEDNSFCKEGDE